MKEREREREKERDRKRERERKNEKGRRWELEKLRGDLFVASNFF